MIFIKWNKVKFKIFFNKMIYKKIIMKRFLI